MSYVVWFKDLNKNSIGVAGGKGTNLGIMYNLGLPVPPGFAVTAQTYKEYIEKTQIKDKIEEMLKGLDVNDTKKLQQVAKDIQKLILATPIPQDIAEEIIDNYELLGADKEAHDLVSAKEVFVAVRSSATAEDLPSISENEHILVTVDGKPVYKEMKEIYGLDPNIQEIKIPALFENKIEWRKVSSIYKHPADGKNLYKITTVTGREVTISENHSLIILDEDNLTPKVVKISDLQGKEKVPAISTLPLINSKETFVDILDKITGEDIIEKGSKIYIKNNSSNWIIQTPLPRKIEFTNNFAYFLGLYASEGSTFENNMISITNSDQEVICRAQKFFKEISIPSDNKINKYTLRVYCKSLVRFLHAVGGKPNPNIKGKGKLSGSKCVPNFVFGWNEKLIGEFLRGAFDGDGGVERDTIGYCSTSHLLIGGVIKLLEMLNIEFTLRKRTAKLDHWSDYYQLSIPSRSVKLYGELIGFESSRKNLSLKDCILKHDEKKYYSEFLHTINISEDFSKLIKKRYQESLSKKTILKAICPLCHFEIPQSSSYHEKKRFHCKDCHKTYYEGEVDFTEKIIHQNFDEKGRFITNATPWNKGNITGSMSQKHFSKEMTKLGLDELSSFFSSSVKWDTIKEIEEIPYSGYVYDFTVPEIENFAAGVGGIITHNSASFAGQQATYLNVKGKDKVVQAVLACWASLYTARAIYYREKNNFEHSKVLISAIVQKMVDSDQAGIMFTINPATNNANEIIIEAVYGLGETIVGGKVNPDLYVVDKTTKEISKIEVRKKDIGLFRNEQGQNEEREISKDLQERQVIPETHIKELARLGRKIEEHYRKPQDIEWAVEKDQIYIVQSRAVTTYKKNETAQEDEPAKDIKNKIILRGETASAGAYSGKVKLIHNLNELSKIQDGDVMVTKMTTPDMVPAMQKAGAIVTNEGGMTCHAAIVSREMGTPCIVGTEHATKVLQDNQTITVDATHGVVYEGKVSIKKEKKKEQTSCEHSEIITATEVKVIMDLPDFAVRAAETGADGVGLVRLEIMIANGKIHPAEYVRQGKIEDYVKLLKVGIGKIAKAFAGKPVWVRCSDMRSDEYRGLEGGDKEPKETDPMIGWHAIRRLLDEPEILQAEFQAIRELHYEGHKNVGVMLPFVIRVDELREAKKIMREVGLEPCKAIDFGVMIETPASCWIIEELCKEGISFVSFGTNDLTQLTLGIDRNNQKIQKLFDEMHPAVLGEIAKVIKVCRKYKVKTSICGQAGSRPEMADFLVHQGVDSISANTDAVDKIRMTVAKVEKKLLLDDKREMDFIP